MQVVIDDENKPFPHRCALEYSPAFVSKEATNKRAFNKLVLVSIVCAIFCATEAVGGVLSGSLAILCDAAHQLSDVAGFVISFLAIWLTKKKSTPKYSFGYHRADVIGALASILIIWGLLVWLLIEAVNRIITPPEEINGFIMLVTAIIGLCCNILNLITLNCCCNDVDEVTGEKQSVF